MSKRGHSQEQIDRKLIRIQSYVDAEERFTKIKDEMQRDFENWINDSNKHNQWKLTNNNIEICKLQRVILENQLLVDKLRKKNYELKTNM